MGNYSKDYQHIFIIINHDNLFNPFMSLKILKLLAGRKRRLPRHSPCFEVPSHSNFRLIQPGNIDEDDEEDIQIIKNPGDNKKTKHTKEYSDS